MASDTLRGRILDAAASVLRERGHTPRLISAVSERAGLSRPTLYKHVGDQTAIYNALLRRELERILDDVIPQAASITDPREGYLDIVAGITHHVRTHPVMMRVLEQHPGIALRHIGQLADIVLEIADERLDPLIRHGIEEGRLPDLDVRTLLVWTCRIIVSLVVMPMPEDEGPEHIRRSVAALFDLAATVPR